MAETRFDFGTKYAILDYKIKEIKETSASSASFAVDSQSRVVTLSLFNSDDIKINESTFTIPIDQLIVDVYLDVENKKLVFDTEGGETIECDFSQLVFKDDGGLVPLADLPKEYNSDFIIKPTTPSQSVGQAQNSNKIILQSSILKALTHGPAYYLKSSVSLTSAQQGFTFSSDGLKLFVVDTSSDTLFQYNLSTAWDVDTIVLPASVSLNILSLDGTMNGLYFKPDGTKIFMIGSGQKRIVSAALSTPWDITNLTVNDFAITTGLISNKAYTCMFMSSSGTKVYVGNSTDDTIDIYTTSTPWDLGTILGTKVASIAIVDQENSITGLFISSDGQSLFIVGSGSDTVYQYTLDEAWGNVATYADKSVAAQQGTTTDIYFKPDGTRLFLLGTSTRKVDEYVVPESWDLAGGEVVTKEIKDSFYAKTIMLDDVDDSVELSIGYTADGDVPVSTPLIKLSKEGVLEVKKIKIDEDLIDNENSEGLDGQILSKQNGHIVWADPFIEITWESLKNLRDNSLLKPGQQYRITDYECTTVQANTQSAGHQFDIIVTADDVNKLNENARACRHDFSGPVTELKVGHTYEYTPPTGDEATTLQTLITTDGNSWYVEFEENNYIGVKDDAENLIEQLLYTASNPQDLNYTYHIDNSITQFTITHDTTIISNEIDLLPYLTDITGNYFANSKLESWQLKYCLDNDTSRFAWADEVNGKGVIYQMIDEFNNDVPYDFKNVQFKRKLTDGELDLDSGIDTWVYTFTMSDLIADKVVDISLKQNTEYPDDEGQYRQCANNSVKEATSDYQLDGLIRIQLNDNVFLNIFDNNVSSIYYGCYYNTFGSACSSNTFGNSCFSNTFGNSCSSNTFGNDCIYNTFGNDCIYNTFSNGCTSNTFGNSCYESTFGNSCNFNTFGNDCSGNTFDDYCYYNSFAGSCTDNTFGASCSDNTFDNSCYFITFGNHCSSNTFGINCSESTFGDYCSFNTIGNDCLYLQISDISSTPKRYIHVENGTQGASFVNMLDLYDPAILNKNYQVTFSKDADGRYVMTWLDDYNKLVGKYKENNLDTTWENLPQDIDGGIW